jgi:hypothetical protein
LAKYIFIAIFMHSPRKKCDAVARKKNNWTRGTFIQFFFLRNGEKVLLTIQLSFFLSYMQLPIHCWKLRDVFANGTFFSGSLTNVENKFHKSKMAAK